MLLTPGDQLRPYTQQHTHPLKDKAEAEQVVLDEYNRELTDAQQNSVNDGYIAPADGRD
jgi:hypothetical protein